MSDILIANNLQKRYQMGQVEVFALHGVSLAVQKGEFIAIMGPSGSGKSTLLHLLGGLDTPTEGEVILGGKSLAHLSDHHLAEVRRRQVGFIFQSFNLLPTLTAVENVFLPLLLDGKRGIDFHDKVREKLSLVGLSDRYNHLPNQLSGGEQQRVAIARALVISPEVILADEPTGNLDSKTAEMILKLLRSICDQENQTIVMVTHDPAAAGYADNVHKLNDGMFLSY